MKYSITTLEDVSISLAYASGGTRTMPWGNPDGGLIYVGKWPNKVRIGQKLEEFVYQPSGWRFPRRRQTNSSSKVSLDGVHVFEGGVSFDLERNRLAFMEIIAYSTDYEYWKRWYFYGVTCAEVDFYDNDVEMNESKVFDAWFSAADGGPVSIPPDPKILSSDLVITEG